MGGWGGGGLGLFLLSNHISVLFHEDTYDHIKLTPYSAVNVKLAAQVLSSIVSRILSQYGSPEASGTVRFCALMDTFFDIMKIRDIHSHQFLRKPSLMPFTSNDDPRFSWLRNVFLQYFEDWLTSIKQRDDKFSKKEKNKIFKFQEHTKGWKFQ